MRKRRFRAVARWVCTVAALVMMGAAVFCLFRSAYCSYVFKDGKTAWDLTLGAGQIEFREWAFADPADMPVEQHMLVWPRREWTWGVSNIRREPGDWRGVVVRSITNGQDRLRLFAVHLFYPFLLTAAPAALLWYSHLRRPRPGLCASCRYPRSGLAPDAPCPECGKVAAA